MNIELPEPNLEGKISLEECIFKRESVRSFSTKDIEIEKISQLLWSAQGVKGDKRTTPSAGESYPLELYLIIRKKGLYCYNPKEHMLKLIKNGDFSRDLAHASLNQSFIEKAPLNIIICADFSRTCIPYGNRGKRYVYLEVGHCAQNINLESIALGLSSVCIGAYEDDKIKTLLELSSNINPLYIIPIGYSSSVLSSNINLELKKFQKYDGKTIPHAVRFKYKTEE